jgi:DNA modification methylase
LRNALKENDYMTLLNGALAAMVLSDPPYNVPIAGNVSGLGRIKYRDFLMGSGELSEAEFTRFLTEVCSAFARHSRDGALHYLFIDWRHLTELLTAGRAAYTELKNLTIWVKNVPGMGSFYRSQHELIAIYKSGRGPHRNNIDLGRNGRNRSNVWSYPGINSGGRTSEEGSLLALHPTVKPVALLADAIMDCTARNDRPGWISRQWLHGNRSPADRPSLLRNGTRPGLRRHRGASLAELHACAGLPCVTNRLFDDIAAERQQDHRE